MKFSMGDRLPSELDGAARLRRELLAGILMRHGMELRDDSQLACDYILNDGDVHMVAHELLCVHFLFCFTNYDALCQHNLKVLAEAIHQQYNDAGHTLSWKQTWSLVREYGVPAMKFLALAQSEVAMPYFDVSTDCTAGQA